MAALPAWRELPDEQRELLFACALLHDVAKPACTRYDPDGRLSSRGHAWRGAIRARAILWRLGVPFAQREAVCAIIRFHLVPFFLIENDNPRRTALEVSQTARCDWLSIMAEADARGRICPDPQRLLDNIALFREQALEEGCLTAPYEFPNPHGRVLYFRDPLRQPDSPAYEDFRCHVVVLSGLPGAGKDHWLSHHLAGWPVLSLDEIRTELGVSPAEQQGEVLQLARERAREYLRAGINFVWNATNLSRTVRGECLRLFYDYNAHVRLVYLEATPEKLFAQNRERKRQVPERVIERLLERWEVPDRTEAHEVDYVLGE